ncbi:MAG: hypothetical protein A2X64_06380 [Ignavibacteria bacterium GWF2_33_9]|nr:MAG: hypothetical protein A2X64_06380 [Ignavibacteria bacterium GWF2_33_9]
MLKLFQNAPAFRFIIFLFIGFFFQKIISIPFDWIYPVITTIVLIAVILSILKKFSISVLLLLFAFGIFTSFRTYNLDFNYSGNFPPQIKGHFQGKVINKLKVKGKTSRYILEGDLILNDFQKIPKTRLHFTLINQQNLPLEFEEGNTIFAKIQYRIPNQATLPNEFDEKSYYRSIDIHYTAFER